MSMSNFYKIEMKMTFVDSFTLLSSRLFRNIYRKTKFLCVLSGRFHMDLRDEAKPTMEIVKVPPIVSIYRQATQTFDDKFKANLEINLAKLKKMMDTLKADDLGFDKTLNDPGTWKKPNKAPCTYIQVFQNDLMNMSVFVLKPGFKMPLHDHPKMYGLLKVVAGAVRIRSFSEYPLKSLDNLDFAIRAKLEAKRITQGFHKRRRLFAKISQDRICRENADTCVLTPITSNYHEIEALEMPAAFFDILAPPYGTPAEGIGPRRCRYYDIANEISTNVLELHEIEVPDCFYCDQAPYLGPMLS